MSTRKGKNILIVDDDEDLINLFKTFLEYDGYKVDTFTIQLMLCTLLEKMYMILFYLI